MVPDWMGWGNNVYQWLWAYEGSLKGEARKAVLPDKHDVWGEMFPVARKNLLISRNEIRITDRREQPWVLGEDKWNSEGWFDPKFLDQFVTECLIPESSIEASDPDRLVINIRRGDYYSVPEYRESFGMPISSFVKESARLAFEGNGSSEIYIVSDDPDWCREELHWLSKYAPVRFAPKSRTPQSDLRTVAAAKQIILANSTFSYWAAYIGDVLYAGDSERLVIAPSFFRRDENGGRSHLLRKNWTIVDLVDGWNKNISH